MAIRGIVASWATVPCQWLILGTSDQTSTSNQHEQVRPADASQEPLPELVPTRYDTWDALVSRLRETKDLTGGVGEVVTLLGPRSRAGDGVVLVGLGKPSKWDAAAFYQAGFAAAKRLAGKPRGVVAALVPHLRWLESFVVGLIVGQRGPDLKKSEAARYRFEELVVIVDENVGMTPDELTQALQRAEILAESVVLARDLANTPPAEKPPVVLAQRIAAAFESLPSATVTIWDEATLKRERFGGLLGVAAGSDQPPAYVMIDYRGPDVDDNAPLLAWVGKGVTFDSGGLSLKPSASMEDMKADMTGAAVVASAALAVAKLGLPIRLTARLALTENLTGGRAMKLGDVLTIRNGKTVEVLNTDAEGRLILADALSHTVEAQPAAMIDLATLTGACMVALGTKIAGLYANRDDLAERVANAAKACGERVWRMPLDDDFKELLKSSVADLKNIGSKWGGSITAAKFLEQFVGETPWAHLDIAGPAWSESDNATADVGASGCFVRSLVELARVWARDHASTGRSNL